MKYIYTDHTNGKVILETEANGIDEADAKFKEKTGVDVWTVSWVGCSIEGDKTKEERDG